MTDIQARAEELAVFAKDPKTRRLVSEMIRLEMELDALSPAHMPHYRVNPNNPKQVKAEPAFYLYHKTLSAYKEIVRVLLKATGSDGEEVSPLRAYLDSVGK